MIEASEKLGAALESSDLETAVASVEELGVGEHDLKHAFYEWLAAN